MTEGVLKLFNKKNVKTLSTNPLTMIYTYFIYFFALQRYRKTLHLIALVAVTKSYFTGS